MQGEPQYFSPKSLRSHKGRGRRCRDLMTSYVHVSQTRRDGPRLEHDGAARRQRGSSLLRCDQEREVPRHADRRHARGLLDRVGEEIRTKVRNRSATNVPDDAGRSSFCLSAPVMSCHVRELWADSAAAAYRVRNHSRSVERLRRSGSDVSAEEYLHSIGPTPPEPRPPAADSESQDRSRALASVQDLNRSGKSGGVTARR